MGESTPARWPVQVVTTVVETDAGRFSLSVTATFSLKLQHGKVAIPTEEAPALEADERVVFDLDAHAPYKPRVDLLISGHACVPEGEDETDRLLVRLRFGDFAKAVRAVGTRVWISEGGAMVVGPARKFRRLRISADRAPKTPENPAGMSNDAVPADGRMARPNFEPVTPLGAANLGPVPDTATTRAQFAPEGALAWAQSLGRASKDPAASAGPKPQSLNYAFFNAAPHDQQLDKWMEGSAVVLEGLHASQAVFTSRMPSFEATAEIVTREGDPPSELRLRTDTLWVLADQELVTLRARGLLPLPDAMWSGKVDVHVRGRDAIEPPAPPTPDMQHTRAAVDLPLETVLPFQKKLAKEIAKGSMFVTQEMQLGGQSALPFGALPEDTTTHDLPEDVLPGPDTQDSVPPRQPSARPDSALPFKALGDDDSTPEGGGDTIPPAPPPKAEARLRPPDLGPTRSPPLPPEEGEDDAKMRTTPMPALGAKQRARGPGATVAMPPLVIPLADGAFDAPTTTADVKLSLRETEELLSAARSTFPLPPSDGFEVDGVTLEHCAVIRAQLNAKPGDRAGVLDHHGLSDAAFATIERTHLRRVDEANQRDEGDLLARYDAAYLAAFESIVRPIDVATYARMAVAKERGDLTAILSDLSLPRTEFMRIERVWSRRIAADRLLGEGFQQAVARARGKPQ